MADPKRIGRVRIPSCEPCRLSKLACDHKRPVCSRCDRRNIHSECIYRKNPFKRGRALALPQATQGRAWSHVSPESTSSQAVQLTLYPNPGFQGSSAVNTILEDVEYGSRANRPYPHGEGDDDDALPDGVGTTSSSSCAAANGGAAAAAAAAGGIGPGVDDGETPRDAILTLTTTTMIEEGAQALDLFADAMTDGSFRRLFDEWAERGLQGRLGSFLVSPFFDTITAVVADLHHPGDRRAGLLELSRRLFEAGKRPPQLWSDMTVDQFTDQHTGQNLRWETVGTILTLAGIAATEIRAPHPLCQTERERHSLRRDLVLFSNKCASFCESLDVLNDVQIIFLYESFLLYSVFYGDQTVAYAHTQPGFQTWRRLNDAISALFARGLHQRLDKSPRTSFFLVELRKQIFARVYASDISFAVFLGRPPRISRRHCVIHVPLDVGRHVYSLRGEALREELAQLDDNGWNVLGQIRTHAVLRWSVAASAVREETLEAILGPSMDDDKQQLINKLRARIQTAWTQLPSFLAVPAREVWARGRAGEDVDGLYLIRLFHLQAVFLIEWTASVHGPADSDALYDVAGDLLFWVNEALIRRECLNKLGLSSLAWRVAACGLPAAGALAKCILPNGSSPRHSTAQAKVIQDLSVLMGHMDHLHEPGDGNFKLFRRAKGVLQKVIATVLQHQEAQTQTTQMQMQMSQFETHEAAQVETQLFGDGAGGGGVADDAVVNGDPGQPPGEGDVNGETMVEGMSGGNGFDPWGFRPEFWIGLPGSVEFDFLDAL